MNFHPKKIESLDDLRAMIPDTALEAMEVRIEEVDDDHVAVVMPVTAKVKQPAGLLHGGMTMFLIETAASVHACWRVDLTKRAPVGIEINGTHLRPATGGTIRAIARVVRRSHTFIVHQVEVVHVESGRQLSTGRVTSFYLRTGRETKA